MADNRINRLVKEALETPEENLVSRLEGGMVDYEKARRAGDLLEMCFPMDYIAGDSFYRGRTAVLKGDPSGWAGILRYCVAMPVAFGIFGIKGTPSAKNVSQALLFLIAAGRRHALAFGAQALEKYLLKGRGKDEVIVPYLAYWCAQRFLGREPHPALSVRAPYDRAVAALGAGLPGPLIDELVGFHLDNCGIRKDDGIEYLPCKLIPVEFFALSTLRDGNPFGYSDPAREFFATPLASFSPADLTYNPEQDEVLKSIIDLAVEKQVVDAGFLGKLSS